MLSAEGTSGPGREPGWEKPARTIGETLSRLETCSELYRLLFDADLIYRLRLGGLHTLFAPVNEAFAQGAPDDLEKTLDQLLVAGEIAASDLARCGTLPTLAGTALTVQSTQDALQVGRATILHRDIACKNGLIHVTDRLPSP